MRFLDYLRYMNKIESFVSRRLRDLEQYDAEWSFTETGIEIVGVGKYNISTILKDT